ncbi:response regulator [Leptolyngbya ectocarpi]|uniref:hypothetical protein n=1 Tax=Leptolyngbya ectocarpi TaxID=1202 RepID=UPI001D14759C|nr:hypothetical protein [Leptolyngbya ectocarpi]
MDDQPKNLRLLSDLLEEQGYEVQQAINGTVALQAVALEQPDGSNYISKPFKVVEVLARVENQLNVQQLQRQQDQLYLQFKEVPSPLPLRCCYLFPLEQIHQRRRILSCLAQG